ncbi:SMI1/KNR4 family protein [Streptomyces liangshanensis]|uniref:SMI1/KNR4 family protein n=1 Tax=Streptomyces liangshanensis TaxID=2717324 RepID=A0A6G9GZB0_9ACTN|nr:SMI1/KNR4 family protein [Streptomyces liangshanensis]QIQ03622.1 SMI1/KNR4 family protein [Streptomyces liangshanensis]
MSTSTWAGVRDRVLGLAERPGADQVFGARGHGFRLGPVMDEVQLRSLEADLGVGLPASYRAFLLHVGGGGAGPDYGLMTPTPGDGGWQWRGTGLGFSAAPTTAEFAGRPFVAEALAGELAALEAREPGEDAYASEEEFRRAYAAWDARYEELYDAQEAGAVFLSEQGCGYSSLMVMTGPHRGAIWEDLRPMDRGIVPTGHNFGDWYRSWLERTERDLAGVRPTAT